MPTSHSRFTLGIPPLRRPTLTPSRVSLTLPTSTITQMRTNAVQRMLTTRHPIEVAARTTGASSTSLVGVIKTALGDGLPLTRSGNLSLTRMSDFFTGSGRIRHPTVYGGKLELRW